MLSNAEPEDFGGTTLTVEEYIFGIRKAIKAVMPVMTTTKAKISHLNLIIRISILMLSKLSFDFELFSNEFIIKLICEENLMKKIMEYNAIYH